MLSFDVIQSQFLVHVLSDGDQADSSHVSPRIPTPPPSPTEETDQSTAPGTWFFSYCTVSGNYGDCMNACPVYYKSKFTLLKNTLY